MPFNGGEKSGERELAENDHWRGEEEALVEHDHETVYMVAEVQWSSRRRSAS